LWSLRGQSDLFNRFQYSFFSLSFVFFQRLFSGFSGKTFFRGALSFMSAVQVTLLLFLLELTQGLRNIAELEGIFHEFLCELLQYRSSAS